MNPFQGPTTAYVRHTLHRQIWSLFQAHSIESACYIIKASNGKRLTFIWHRSELFSMWWWSFSRKIRNCINWLRQGDKYRHLEWHIREKRDNVETFWDWSVTLICSLIFHKALTLHNLCWNGTRSHGTVHLSCHIQRHILRCLSFYPYALWVFMRLLFLVGSSSQLALFSLTLCCTSAALWQPQNMFQMTHLTLVTWQGK